MSGVGFFARVPKSFLITQLPGVGFSFKDSEHEDLNGITWKSEPYYLLYIPNPRALPHGIRHMTVHYFQSHAVKNIS